MTLAWLTGASRGIGRATALHLARRGADLVLFGRRSPSLETVSRTIADLGVAVTMAEAELTEAETTVRACREQLERGGAPDAVINIAAVVQREPVETLSLDHWERQMAVNLRAPYLITREALPAMRAKRCGRIVHVASISSTLGTAHAAAYCASKWGLVGFMKSLAEELRNSGLMTVAILPGSVDTEMLQGSGFAPRMSPEEVACTLVHYALDAPLAHNGSIIEMFGV
jgi:3-oxoacyl-[acyl-carrier protein] reductase